MSDGAGINPPLSPTTGGLALLALALVVVAAMVIVLASGDDAPSNDPPAPGPAVDRGVPSVIAATSAPGLTIPDYDEAGIADILVVEDDAVVGAVEVGVVITHSYPSELTAELTSPSGTVAELFSGTQTPPEQFDATNAPELDELVGEPARGEWVLSIRDSVAADEGTLKSWSLAVATD